VRGGDEDEVEEEQGNKPATLGIAMDRYKDDLVSRGAGASNATTPKGHLPASLLSKPVPLLDSQELRKWRDGLLAKMAPASVNRYCKVVKAALAARSDRRIKNAHAWETGLQLLPDANEVNNVILTNPQVISFVAGAYAHDEKLGEFTDVLAQSGARPSQAARLYVRDLIMHKTEPRLMMPKSAKGGGLNRTSKRSSAIPCTSPEPWRKGWRRRRRVGPRASRCWCGAMARPGEWMARASPTTTAARMRPCPAITLFGPNSSLQTINTNTVGFGGGASARSMRL
jgi:hypothetical protein